MANNFIRRTRYFVERGFQLRFARVVILFAFGSAVFTGLTVFYTAFMLLGERLADVYPQGRLSEIFRNVHLALAADLIIILPFIFYGSLVFSHRIAGPLPKIYNTLRQIGQGNFDVHLVLRKRDELKELAEVINKMAKDLKEREKKK